MLSFFGYCKTTLFGFLTKHGIPYLLTSGKRFERFYKFAFHSFLLAHAMNHPFNSI